MKLKTILKTLAASASLSLAVMGSACAAQLIPLGSLGSSSSGAEVAFSTQITGSTLPDARSLQSQKIVNGLAGEHGLIQGTAGNDLNKMLTGLLVGPSHDAGAGLSAVLTGTLSEMYANILGNATGNPSLQLTTILTPVIGLNSVLASSVDGIAPVTQQVGTVLALLPTAGIPVGGQLPISSLGSLNGEMPINNLPLLSTLTSSSLQLGGGGIIGSRNGLALSRLLAGLPKS